MKHLILIISFMVYAIVISAQEDFTSWIRKANEAVNMSNYEEALANFEAAFKIGNPDSAKIAWNAGLAGICAQELQQNKKAIELFMMALQHGSSDMDIYNRLIDEAQKDDNIEAEEQALLIGKENIPGLDAKNNSKLLYLYYNSQQYEKASKMADIVLQEKSGNSKVMYLKAVSLYKLEQNEDAIETLTQILNSEPDNAEANSMLGIIYYQEASNDFNKFTDQYNSLSKPTRVDYAVYMRNIATCNPTYQKALPYLLKAYELKPDNAVKVAIFNSYIRLEQKDKAEKYR